MLHNKLACFELLLIVAFVLFGRPPRAAVDEADSLENDGPVIDSVVIENNDIFDTSDPEYDSWVYSLANEFHIRTKKGVIAREVLLKPGDPYSRELADETGRNLRALPYIYEARVVLDTSDGLNCLKVITSDRWTLAGGPSISRSSRETIYKLGLQELNLLGYGQQLEADYYIREYQEDYLEASLFERRLLNSRQSLYLYYNGDPEVGLKSFSLSRPYYNLNDKTSWNISYSDFDRDDRYYIGGVEVSSYNTRGRRLSLSYNYRFGSYLSKVSFGLNYQYHDISIRDREIYYGGIPIVFPEDSLYHAIIPSLGVSRVNYIQTTRIDRFKKTEDIDLNTGASLSFGWYYDGPSRDLLYRSIVFALGYSTYWKSNLLSINYSRGFYYNSTMHLRKKILFTFRYYNNSLKFLTPAFRFYYSIDNRFDRRLSQNVGEDTGLRGYPRHFVAGEKLLKINYENRFFTGISIMSAQIGAVQFIDAAQGLLQNQGVRFDRFYWAFGFGLRFAPEKIGNADIIRIDLAYARELKEWQISFGVGQYF